MNDREAAGLKGAVYSCETLRKDSNIAEIFDAQGNRTERRYRGPGGAQHHSWWSYDTAGRLRSYESTGRFMEFRRYEYDAHHRLTAVTRSSPAGDQIAEAYEYDDDGSFTVTMEPVPLSRKGGQIGIDSEALLRIDLDVTRLVVRHDRHGRPVWRVLYDVDGRIVRKVLLRYDSAGRLVEESEVDTDGEMSADFRDVYRYNAEGRCTQKDILRNGIGDRRRTMTYNDSGDLNEQTNIILAGGIDWDEFVPEEYRHPRSWTQQFSYEYDAWHNWTLRTETGTTDGGDSIPSIVSERRLKYT